jgi:hypothetical protein
MPKPGMRPMCCDARHKRIRPADLLKLRQDVAVVQAGIIIRLHDRLLRWDLHLRGGSGFSGPVGLLGGLVGGG